MPREREKRLKSVPLSEIHQKAGVHFVSFGNVSERELRFFGRRKGKAIKGTRQQLLKELLPKVRLTLPSQGTFFDLPSCFGARVQTFWLEIGFGGGEHVADLARRYPQVGFIGAEPFLNGVSSLLAHLNGSHETPMIHTGLASDRVDNVRIWPDDGRMLFSHFLDCSFERVFVLYPDPWPKARHAGRRFINQSNLEHLYRIMCPEGLLFVATDVPAYAEWALEQAKQSGLFEQVSPDTTRPPDDWSPTRYEKKALLQGRQPYYLVFRKKKP